MDMEVDGGLWTWRLMVPSHLTVCFADGWRSGRAHEAVAAPSAMGTPAVFAHDA